MNNDCLRIARIVPLVVLLGPLAATAAAPEEAKTAPTVTLTSPKDGGAPATRRT